MRLTDAAIARVREMIAVGELKAGQRLPPEQALSDALGLSRNGLREAVKALELMHVLDVRQGDGTYVTSLEPSVLLKPLALVVGVRGNDDLLELLVVRRILEPAAAASACARIDEDSLDELQLMLADVRLRSEVEELIDHDLAFHSLLTAASENAYLSALLDAMNSRSLWSGVWGALVEQHSAREALEEHRQILVAVRDHDPLLVQALSTAHIRRAERLLPVPDPH